MTIPIIDLDAGGGSDWLRERPAAAMRVAEAYVRGGHLLLSLALRPIGVVGAEVIQHDPDGTRTSLGKHQDVDDALDAVVALLVGLYRDRMARIQVTAGAHERELIRRLRGEGIA